jgi:GxxExxY protein
MIDDALTQSIIECAIEVHRELGPGLLESTYQACISHELRRQRISFLEEPALMVNYKGLAIPNAYRPDLIVGGEVIVELKHVEKLLSVHEAQVRTYLKVSGLPTGLLVNFNSTVLKNGLRRLSLKKHPRLQSLPLLPTTRSKD